MIERIHRWLLGFFLGVLLGALLFFMLLPVAGAGTRYGGDVECLGYSSITFVFAQSYARGLSFDEALQIARRASLDAGEGAPLFDDMDLLNWGTFGFNYAAKGHAPGYLAAVVYATCTGGSLPTPETPKPPRQDWIYEQQPEIQT